jgi:hypothetical protein
MKQYYLYLFIMIGLSVKSQTKDSSMVNTKVLSKKELNRKKKYLVLMGLNTMGTEVSQPLFRNDFQVQGVMSGPVVQAFSFLEVGLLNGTAVKRSNPLVTSNASMYFVGLKFHKLLTTSRSFNFGPIMGMRFMLSELNDPYIKEGDAGTGTFGIGAYAGAFLKIGPVTINAKYHADGNINFSKKSSFKSLSSYPSIGIAFSPLEIIMNPTEFSHKAMAHWREDEKTTISKYKEYSVGGTVYDVTKFTTTWTDKYGEKEMKCKDVQPFFFLGPRFSSSISQINKKQFLSAYGINAGYRRGALYLNSYIEKANIYFKEPFVRNTDTSIANNAIFKGRIDGAIKQSTKYGAQIGVEWINWLQSKDYIYRESSVRSATAYTSLITFIGLGQVRFGNIAFNSDSGLASYKNYLQQNTFNASSSKTNLLLNGDKATYLNFGLQFGIGAIAINAEYTIYDKSYKLLNGWNVGFNYNLPIARIIRAIKVSGMKRKTKKELSR